MGEGVGEMKDFVPSCLSTFTNNCTQNGRHPIFSRSKSSIRERRMNPHLVTFVIRPVG